MENKRKLNTSSDTEEDQNNKRLCAIQFSNNKPSVVASIKDTDEDADDDYSNSEDSDILKIIDDVEKKHSQEQNPVISGNGEEKLESVHYFESIKQQNVSTSTALVLANSIMSNDFVIAERKMKYDILMLKLSDFNEEYAVEHEHMMSFFKPEQINQNDKSITALFKNELISKTDTFNYNRDSLTLKVDLPKGFLNYMCDAANESPNNCVDINKYNLITFEQQLHASNSLQVLDHSIDENSGIGAGVAGGSNIVTFKKNNKNDVYSLPIRFCQAISTFGGTTETIKLLASCTGWFKGKIEKKTCVSKSTSKSFSSYFLRIDPFKCNTFVNGLFRTDDYFRLSRGIYFVKPMEDTLRFKLYTLNESNARVSIFGKSFETVIDREVLIEFKNLELLLLDNMHFLLRGVVSRIVDLDFITGTSFENK